MHPLTRGYYRARYRVTRDRIVQFNGQPITDAVSLTDLVSRVRPEQKANIVYVRDGAEKTVEIILASMPGSVPAELRTSFIPSAETEEPAKADLVKLRYFAGLSLEEAAEALGISRTTASRYWAYARVWLFSELSDQ